MAVEVLTHVYTTQDEMERLISSVGLSSRVADLTGANRTQYLLELVEEATDVINQYVDIHYDAEDLANSRWVHSRASWIGLTLICWRRGNAPPQGILDRYEQILTELENVRIGRMQIPRLATTNNALPSMDNLRVDDKFNSRKIRVNPSISTNQGGFTNQDLDWWWSYDWF